MTADHPSARAGRFARQPTGYRAFVPAPLPPDPPIHLDGELANLLSQADHAVGRLDGVASILPNPNLFVAMYVRHEAVLSSQIEGTQSTLEDVLDFEIGEAAPGDAQEVVNYVDAMNHGLARLGSLPLSLRLLREIHQRLMQGVRGADKSPGEFRTTQNWIGPAGSNLETAAFVPPSPADLWPALDAFEKFLNEGQDLPILIHCGLAHAQFETIHPFLDGNGRVGRLLITFLLCERQVLGLPLLYLSAYLKSHRTEYYDRLTAIRSRGSWEEWLCFFLRGVRDVSRQATRTARKILDLREASRAALAGSATALTLLDRLFEQPVLDIRLAQKILGCSFTTASSTVAQLEDKEILTEITGQRRNRRYRFSPYLQLFRENLPDNS